MRALVFGIVLFTTAAVVPGVTARAQTDSLWINVYQGQELLATVAVKPLAEVRREGITPRAGSNAVSMAVRFSAPVAQTAVRVTAAPLDRHTELTADEFLVSCWRSNGTAYISVSSITSDPLTGQRQSPLGTFAVAPGQSRELVEAKALGAAPLTIAAVAGPAAVTRVSSNR